MANMTRTEYLDYIKRAFKRTDKDTELIEALDDTLYDLSTNYDFQVSQTETEITVTANTYSYTYPATYALLVSDVRYIDSGGKGRSLNKMSKDLFDAAHPDIKESTTTKGDPVDYTIYGNEIFVAPFLQSVSTEKLYVSGSTVATPLANSTDEPLYEDRWREVIKFGTLYRANNDMDMVAQASRYFDLYQNGIERMKRVDEMKDDGIDLVSMDNSMENRYYGEDRQY